MEIITRSLGRGRSHFVGFSGARADHLLSECDMGLAPAPMTDTLRDCVYLPQRHALYTMEGLRIDSTGPAFLEPGLRRIPGQQRKLDRENAEKCPDRQVIPAGLERAHTPMLLMGTVIPHFGHFLTDSLSRLWALEEAEPEEPLLCLGPIRGFAKPYEQLIGAALGLDDRLIAPIAPTVFSEIVCPWPAIQLARRAYRVMDRPHRRVSEVLLRATGSDIVGRPIYLSRRRLGGGHRALFGEDALESRLEKAGYAIVHPEALSLPQQIAVFENDEPIVGAIGSAFHTLLFRLRETPARLALLTDDYVHQRFLLQDGVKPVDAHYLRCMSHRDGSATAALPLQEQTLEIDVDLALAQLEEIGFL